MIEPSLRAMIIALSVLFVAWACVSATIVATHRTAPVADKPDTSVCEIPADWQDYYLTTFVNCASVSIKRSA